MECFGIFLELFFAKTNFFTTNLSFHLVNTRMRKEIFKWSTVAVYAGGGGEQSSEMSVGVWCSVF